MPGQLANKVVVELTADQKQSIAILSAVQAHLALIKDHSEIVQDWDEHRSGESLITLVRYEWLELYCYIDTVLVKGCMREKLYERVLATLQFCIITCMSTAALDQPLDMFLKTLSKTVASVRELSITGLEEMKEQVIPLLNDVCENSKVDDRITPLLRLIQILKQCFMMKVDEQIVENKMDMFVPGMVEEAEGRKFRYEGTLRKRTHKGKYKTYRVCNE